MKRRLLIVLFVVVMAMACAFGMVACGDDEDSVDGTYVMYAVEGTEAEPGPELVLKDGKATMKKGEHTDEGTYSVKDGKLVITFNGDSLTLTKRDNYWYFAKLIFCKKGITPKGYSIVNTSDVSQFDGIYNMYMAHTDENGEIEKLEDKLMGSQYIIENGQMKVKFSAAFIEAVGEHDYHYIEEQQKMSLTLKPDGDGFSATYNGRTLRFVKIVDGEYLCKDDDGSYLSKVGHTPQYPVVDNA